MSDLTYFESLKVAWFITWQSFIIGAALGWLGFTVGSSLGIPKSTLVDVLQLIGLVCGTFVILPLMLGLAIRKQYDGFRFQVVRDAK